MEDIFKFYFVFVIASIILGKGGEASIVNDGDDGLLHPTPMLGFSSWNAFNINVDEEKIMQTVDAIKKLKLDEYGYTYVIIDDLWSEAERDEQDGRLKVNASRFPSGIKNLSNYIHQKGLKFGIYANAGHKTCQGMAGSLGHEREDIQQFMEWEIDYLKLDNCYPYDGQELYKMDPVKSLLHLPSMYQSPDEYSRFSKMARELRMKSRNVTLELCLYGWGNVEKWGKQIGGHLWRTAGDIKDRWPSLLANLDKNDEPRFVENQGPNKGWNYPDALFVGKGGMKYVEYKSMFALWCIVKSPLMLGTDLTTFHDKYLAMVTNQALLDINQDSLGVQATCRKNCCSKSKFGAMYPALSCPEFMNSWQVWSGPLSGGDFVVLLLNRYDHDIKDVRFDWSKDAKIPEGTYEVSDVWKPNTNESIIIDTAKNKTWTVPLLGFHDNWTIRLKAVNDVGLP